MDILTHTAQSYIDTFGGLRPQFSQWGTMIFASLLSINLTWMCLWYAFNKEEISKSLPSFLRQMFIIGFFYMLILSANWLLSILQTSSAMGQILTGIPVDPSSLVSNGIMIGNKIIEPISTTSLLTGGFGLIVVALVYIIVVAIFILIAIDLAVSLMSTTALITISPIFLGFGALKATTQVARTTIDVILANSVKLLGLYIVVAVGGKTIVSIAQSIPANIQSFDPYLWLLAATGIFYVFSKTLPNQLGKIVSGAIQENHGAEMIAIAMAATQYAKSALPAVNFAAGGAAGLAKIAGSTLNNAASHFSNNVGTAGIGAASVMAAGSTAKDIFKASTGTVSDHFKNLSSKISGGPGMEGHNGKVQGFSSRMYSSAQNIKGVGENNLAQNTNNSVSKPLGDGSPTSSGKVAASPSSNRSAKPSDAISKPKQ